LNLEEPTIYESILVGGLEPWNFHGLSHHIGKRFSPTDDSSVIFFRGLGGSKPPDSGSPISHPRTRILLGSPGFTNGFAIFAIRELPIC
jgi:hypothetical protein